LKIDGQIVTDSDFFADAFAHHLESTYSSFSLAGISPPFVNSDLVSVSLISADKVSTAIKHLKSSKGMGCSGIPSFIMKGFSHVFVLLFVHIFNTSLTSQMFPSLYKKGSSFVVSNYRLISLLNNFF